MQEDTEVSDSPELAALRLWASHRLDGEARALVRMVDELRARLSHAEELVGCPKDGELHLHILAHLDSHDQLTQERDELRAERERFGEQAREVGSQLVKRTLQLTETEIERDQLRAKLSEASDLIGELREKLAEGERMLRAENADMRLHMRRADAAEARVRKLTDALFAATGGHVDLDRLVP